MAQIPNEIAKQIMEYVEMDYFEKKEKAEKWLNKDHPEYLQIYNDIFVAKCIMAKHFNSNEFGKTDHVLKIAKMIQGERRHREASAIKKSAMPTPGYGVSSYHRGSPNGFYKKYNSRRTETRVLFPHEELCSSQNEQ